MPNHVVSATDVPAEFAGRAIRCRRLDMLPVECVARGYLTGVRRGEYERTGAVSGVALPPGLVEASRLPEPIFTPSTKAPAGAHDEPISFDQVVDTVGAGTAEALRDITLDVYRRGADARRRARRSSIADTKIEIGRAPDGTLVLADEVLTPDSSRFWPADVVPAGPGPVLLRQAVRARLGDGRRLGQAVAAARGAGRGRRGDPRPLHRDLRALTGQPF